MSIIKKETKSPALLKLPIYSTELAAVIFFLKRTMLNAHMHLQRSHSFIVKVLIRQFLNSSCSFFFYLGFLSRKYTIHRTAGEGGGGFLFNSSLPLLPVCRNLNISRTTTAGSPPLHIASSRTRTLNLWLPSTSH